jgi:PEP-CTERM motif-containing protein
MENKIGKMVVAISIIALAVSGAAQAELGPIAVPNFSFELDQNGVQVTPGMDIKLKDITGLSLAWNEIIQDPEDAYPLIKEPGVGTIVCPDGDFCLLLKSRDLVANDSAAVWQYLAGETIAAGDEYLLTFDAATHGAAGGTTVIASLIYDNAGTRTTIISEEKTATVGDLEGVPWDEFTVPFTVPAGASYIGEDIGIQFQNTGEWTVVDNVRLDLVPEPATMALLGLGSLTLLRRRRA